MIFLQSTTTKQHPGEFLDEFPEELQKQQPKGSD